MAGLSLFSVVCICFRQKSCLLIERWSFLLDSEWQPFDKFLLLSLPSGTFQHGLSPLSCFFFVPPSLDNIRKKKLDISLEENEFNVEILSARSSKEHVAGSQFFWQSLGETWQKSSRPSRVESCTPGPYAGPCRAA